MIEVKMDPEKENVLIITQYGTCRLCEAQAVDSKGQCQACGRWATPNQFFSFINQPEQTP